MMNKPYSREEVEKETLKYFNGDTLATDVWISKYCLKDKDGNLLEKKPDDMHWRLAQEFGRIEKEKYDARSYITKEEELETKPQHPLSTEFIFKLLKGFKHLIPQGSLMYGIGNNEQIVSLSNCVVIPPVEDSYLGIMHTDTLITQLSARRCGVGWDISKLRPKGTPVRNAAGSTSGAISFMHRFSNTINEVCQAGRRGASLQCIHVKHPEIMSFITCKNDENSITGSNISIKFTDEFLKAVLSNKQFKLEWPVDGKSSVEKDVSAAEIWEAFIKNARNHAEPGAIFIDTVYNESTSYPYRKFGFAETAPNPCGEQYLPPNSNCRLLLINMTGYVNDPFTKNASFDYKLFDQHAQLLQRLADDVVDLEVEKFDQIIDKIESDPEPDEIKASSLSLWKNMRSNTLTDRRTGCGFTGLADTLAMLGINYQSNEAIKWITKTQRKYRDSLYESSVSMAEILGPFPIYDKKLDITSNFIQRIEKENPDLYKRMRKSGRRNMTIMTVAPAGTVSIVAQTSSGLEPVFELSYVRRKKILDDATEADFIDSKGVKWEEYKVYHHNYKAWKDTPDHIENPFKDALAHDIDWQQRIKLQAAIQKYCDNSLSTTINLPADTPEEVVSEIYLKSWKAGCKGCTIYRDGSRAGVLVTETKPDSQFAPKRPKTIPCDVYHISRQGKPHFVLVGKLDGKPYEIFAGDNKAINSKVKTGTITKIRRGRYRGEFDDGSELSPVTIFCSDEEEEMSRMTSLALRHGIGIEFILQQLSKSKSDMSSFSKSMARALKGYIGNGKEAAGESCPECNGRMIFQNGCPSCQNCGFSKC